MSIARGDHSIHECCLLQLENMYAYVSTPVFQIGVDVPL